MVKYARLNQKSARAVEYSGACLYYLQYLLLTQQLFSFNSMDIRIESYQLLVAAKPQFPLSGDSILLGMREEKYALDSELVEKAEEELERLNAVVAEKESVPHHSQRLWKETKSQ